MSLRCAAVSEESFGCTLEVRAGSVKHRLQVILCFLAFMGGVLTIVQGPSVTTVSLLVSFASGRVFTGGCSVA